MLTGASGDTVIFMATRPTHLVVLGVVLKLVSKAGAVLAVPAFLLLLVAGSVAWAINDPGLYRNGFERYGISQRTGITDADLDRIGGELRTYFNTGIEPLDVRAPIYGVEQQVFNDREIAHMYDVKRLVRGTYWVAIGGAAWIVVVAATGFASQRRNYIPTAARAAVWAGSVTVVSLLGFGLAAVTGFGQLFLLFHRLSFANDLWILDPRTDYLLIMFPGGFWFDATMRVALTAVLGAVLLLAVGIAALLYHRWAASQGRPVGESAPSASSAS